jgi:Cft2 family RNA processing exonuclease
MSDSRKPARSLRQYLAGHVLGSELWKALKLERPVRRVVITADINEPVTIDVTYLAESKDAGSISQVMVELTRRYRLIEIDPEDAEGGA